MADDAAPYDDEYQQRLDSVLAGAAPGVSNTFERAVALDAVIHDDRVNQDVEIGPLVKAWGALCDHYSADSERGPYPTSWPGAAENPLQYLAHCVGRGYYPPPSIMLVVMECVHHYYETGGAISLDEAFFGAPHKVRNSTARRQQRDTRYRRFDYEVSFERRMAEREGRPPKSLEVLAEEHMRGLGRFECEGMDAEALRRGYHRWLAENPDKN